VSTAQAGGTGRRNTRAAITTILFNDVCEAQHFPAVPPTAFSVRAPSVRTTVGVHVEEARRRCVGRVGATKNHACDGARGPRRAAALGSKLRVRHRAHTRAPYLATGAGL
jgi:hypothetical protein